MRVLAVVNERARRGGANVARVIRSLLPNAQVELTRSLEELTSLAKSLAGESPSLILVAGGDGSAAALLNALKATRRAEVPRSLGRLALLKLGTGNGWANSVGAPAFEFSLTRLRRAIEREQSLPFRRFDLLEVEGLIAQFAGTGWDAELIDDFHAQKTEPSLLPRRVRQGLFGYLNGLFTRAVPRSLSLPRVEVEVENLGGPAMAVNSAGAAYELAETQAGGSRAQVYSGPVSVCSVGTSQEWGFRFRAFPFAETVPGTFNLRMYVGGPIGALARVPAIWSGHHPVSNMHNFLLQRCEVRFSRAVPLQAGGDLIGHRDKVQYSVARETVEVLDWSRLIVPELAGTPWSTVAPTALASLSKLVPPTLGRFVS
jgi:diacylglycerol kinase family enzyme